MQCVWLQRYPGEGWGRKRGDIKIKYTDNLSRSFPGPLLERFFLYTTFDPRFFKDHDSRIEIARGGTRVLYGANCKVLGTPLCRINLINLFEGFFTETCEGMLSLNNDEIRPEVACAKLHMLYCG